MCLSWSRSFRLYWSSKSRSLSCSNKYCLYANNVNRYRTNNNNGSQLPSNISKMFRYKIMNLIFKLRNWPIPAPSRNNPYSYSIKIRNDNIKNQKLYYWSRNSHLLTTVSPTEPTTSPKEIIRTIWLKQVSWPPIHRDGNIHIQSRKDRGQKWDQQNGHRSKNAYSTTASSKTTTQLWSKD